MGLYLNPRNDSFQQAINNPIYVDKSLLINYTNQLIGTGDNKLCVCLLYTSYLFFMTASDLHDIPVHFHDLLKKGRLRLSNMFYLKKNVQRITHL